MISVSHWGMFLPPAPVFIVPKLTKEQERELLDSWNKPGHIVYISAAEHAITRISEF